ncbi:MAG: hypothetical protein IJ761_03700 [Bacteroidales bacterium]|nr:hypothetical protein [Bacteroidales bacterium]
MRRKIIVFFFALCTALYVPAQGRGLLDRCEFLLSAGGMNYGGDLNNQSLLGQEHLAYSIGVRTTLDNRWALRANIGTGKISGGDPDCIELRNLSFRSTLYEASVVGEFSFWPYVNGVGSMQGAFYIFCGLCVFHHNPQASYEISEGEMTWVDLQPLHTEGQGSVEYPQRKPYLLTQVGVPFGVGFKWQVNKSISLSVEYGIRKTWTDYLDDVSTTYVSTSILNSNSTDGHTAALLADRSGEGAPGHVYAEGVKRGDSSLNDFYTFLHISAGISLDKLLGWTRSKKCN